MTPKAANSCFQRFLLLTLKGFIVTNYLVSSSAFAQSTSNQSTVQNSAAPSASSVTTGGTNVNTQVNNAYANDIGFGGGINCRTPKLFVTGNTSKVDAYQNDALQSVHNNNNNYNLTAGIIVPFGSKINKFCSEIASEITSDRKIASQLSMIRACDDLLKKGIRVDPEKFPLLAPCADYETMMKNVAQAPLADNKSGKKISLPPMTPLTDRAL